MLLMVAKQWSSLQIKEHFIVDFTFFFALKLIMELITMFIEMIFVQMYIFSGIYKICLLLFKD